MLSGASILKNYYVKLYNNYLAKYVAIPSLRPSEEEESNVKAFCVLAHAALEEFFENLTRETLQKGINKYRSKVFISKMLTAQVELDKANICLTQLIETLLLASNFAGSSGKHKTLGKLKTLMDEVKGNVTPAPADLINYTQDKSTYATDILIETTNFYYNYLITNHGASLSYLIGLLIPVGINIPNNMKWIDSLQQLCKNRGAFAHTQSLTIVTSASDMKGYAEDIIQLCFEVQNKIPDFDLL